MCAVCGNILYDVKNVEIVKTGEKMNILTINEFLIKLGSEAPVPGGGGASALVGGISAALCSMVASLTTGKKKYAEFQEDIERILAETAGIVKNMQDLIKKDAEVFEPLSRAYGIPKDDPTREAVLDDALKLACSAPMDILCEAGKIVPILEELAIKGSKIALSDVGVAATACRAAIQGGALNVFINTRLIKDRDFADKVDCRAQKICDEYIPRCDAVYKTVESCLKRG